MNNIKLAALQYDIAWQNPATNRAHLDTLLEEIDPTIDLILLPEMFNTGFSTASDNFAESMDGETMNWISNWAKKLNAVMSGSLMIADQDKRVNRMVWVKPDASVEYYDKRHLFRMAGEHEHFDAGAAQKIVHLKGMRFCLQVCYDLRFPVWSRNRFTQGEYDYDCIIYIANWPSPRANAWRDLLRARAIENLSYCIGLNRVGTDNNGMTYLGDSCVLDYKGLDLARADDGPAVIYAELSADGLKQFREAFPVGMDADDFTLKSI